MEWGRGAARQMAAGRAAGRQEIVRRKADYLLPDYRPSACRPANRPAKKRKGGGGRVAVRKEVAGRPGDPQAGVGRLA